MKKQKIGPNLFIGVLLLIITFVGGVRYGKKVEETNKTIRYVLSITPVKPLPTYTPTQIKFETFGHEGCGISFLYPAMLKKQKESSESAQFQDDQKTTLAFSCSQNITLLDKITDQKVATAAIVFKNKHMLTKKEKKENREVYIFTVKQPLTGRVVEFTVDSSLYAFFEKTVEFKKK